MVDWSDGRKVFFCTWCGRKRGVKTTPQSRCMCRVKFPNRYMYLTAIVDDFFLYVWQSIHVLFRGAWRR